ncbi:efflux RND transporter periplasmic adaptor subunit [Pseudomonas paralcaligenes]|uniref:efflux RND transporter periplasmic adaptor subunit n=1 Tax=Pseudomonas paralcaligenes TaxID=2772558 RepID=UPI001C7FEA03|nr:efflux RND transporter periplasmic adaptor subunit [Pseudomonas paralcaligenes]
MTRPPRSRRALALATSMLAGLALLGAAWPWLGDGGARHETQAIARGDIQATVHALGRLEPITEVEVGVQVSGQIVRLLVQPGDTVRQGQLLAEIDASLHQATVEAGRARLAALRAQLADQQAQTDLARQQLARQRLLQRQDATRLEDVEVAQAAMRSAQARIAAFEAQLWQVTSELKGDEALLGYTRVHAPIAGTVISVEARAGQTLNAEYQTPPLLSIADLSRMTVRVSVAEADIGHVQAGMAASFVRLGNDARRWQGTVRQVLPAPPKRTDGAPATSTAVSYPVLFEVDNADGALKPAMSAQVAFVTAAARDVPLVPLTALTPLPGQADHFIAHVLDARGRPVERRVTLGVRDRRHAQVIAGLDVGERLVLATTDAP